jgi:hypothetical protein
MDRKFALLLIPFSLVIIGPYLLAWIWPSPGFVFAGFLFNPIDGNSYLAKMAEGWRGDWAFTLPYTAQKGSGAPIFLFYLALGHLARITTIPTIWVFHLTRVIGAFLLAWALYLFALPIFPGSKLNQRESAALALFGSGLGWIFILFGIILSDVWVAEGYPFLSSFSSPHFTIGMALLICIFILLLKQEQPFQYLQLALSGLLLAGIMPFGLVVACAVAGIWTLVEWKKNQGFHWRSLFSLSIPGGVYLCYQYWVIQQDSLLSQWNAQNLTPSPPVWDFLLSFAPALLLAGWGAWKWLRNPQTSPGQRLLLGWLIGGLVLIYFPFALQRRFIFAFFLPVSFLAAAGFQAFRERWPSQARKWIPTIKIIAMITNGVVILLAVFGVLSRQPIFFLSHDEAEGFRYIQNSLPADAVILCSPETGLFLPAWTGRRVLYGHEFETVNAPVQKALVAQLLQGSLALPQQSDLMNQNKIQYVFSGPREKIIGSPDFHSFMKPVFQNASVVIYSW